MVETITNEAGEKWDKTTTEEGEVFFSRNTDHIKYKEVGGMSFHESTSNACCKALVKARTEDIRVKLYQGDIATGIPWAEEWDTIGWIGRSTGQRKIPLMITGKRSSGGGGVLDHCLLAIKSMDNGEYLYKAKNYKPAAVTIGPSKQKGYTYSTFFNGKLHGNHKTLEDAERTKAILEGACVPSDMKEFEDKLENQAA